MKVRGGEKGIEETGREGAGGEEKKSYHVEGSALEAIVSCW